MKAVVYKRPDGGISVFRPFEGARLAFFITLPDGSRLPSGVAPFTERRVDSIVRGWPVDGAVAEWAEPEEAFLSRLLAHSLPDHATNVRVVEASEVPADRTFRNAWKDEGFVITVDMPQAREIHRDYLRELRKPKLEALDVQYLIAQEQGNQALMAGIAAQKQVLRDATDYPAIEAATTPEELKAAIPPVLA